MVIKMWIVKRRIWTMRKSRGGRKTRKTRKAGKKEWEKDCRRVIEEEKSEEKNKRRRKRRRRMRMRKKEKSGSLEPKASKQNKLRPNTGNILVSTWGMDVPLAAVLGNFEANLAKC